VNLSSPLNHLTIFRTTTRGRWDTWTPLALGVLSLIGVAFIYSAQLSIHGRGWISQCVWLVLGAGVYLATSLIDYRFWLGIAHWFYAACLVPLVLVLIPGIGNKIDGSRRWLTWPPGSGKPLLSFQPSDLAMIGILLITASILIRSKIGTISQSLGVLGKLALAVGVPMLLIFREPDLKSAIVLPPMVFSMLYVSRLSTRFFAAALGVFLLIAGVITWDIVRYAHFMDGHGYSFQEQKGAYEPHSWVPLHDYQRNRILPFIVPDKADPMNTGWNQTQSLISVGSGGLTGKGWLKGTQAQLGYLPRSVAPNDFIFSVIAEEKGFLGSIMVLSLFGVVLFNGIRIAGLSRDRLGTLLAIGVTVLFTVHVFVNIAMTIRLVPITGIPLPFISHGGSFVLSCCLLQGLVQSVYRFRKDFA
jgi:rod shape determining protein RodA